MITHILKTEATFWDAIDRGEKTFEVRKNDRDFQVGDTLLLRRLPTLTDEISRRITYILPGGQYGIDPDYAVLALAPLD